MALRAKLLLFLLPLVVGPLLGLGWLAYTQLRDDAKANLLREMDILLEQVALSEQTQRRTAMANLELFVGSDLVERFVFAPEHERVDFLLLPLMNLFASYHDAYGQYDEIRLLDAQGRELASYRSDDRQDAAPLPGLAGYLEALSAGDDPAAARYLRDRDGKSVLLVARKLVLVDPVFEDNSIAEPSMRGYLLLIVTPEGLERQARESGFGKRGRILFIDADGRRLFPDAHHPALRRFDGTETRLLQDAAASDQVQALDLIGAPDPELAKARTLTPGLLLTAVIPEAELLEDGADLGLTVVIVSLVALILATSLLLAVVNLLVVRPVGRLKRGAAAIGAGDLQMRLPERGRDELASLAAAFNQMAASLDTSQREKDKAQQEALSNKQLAIDNLRKADQLKDEFLANTSHELRTPLHGIIGLAESLRAGIAGPLPASADENLQTIVTAGRRLANLVNDILDFARLRHRDLRLSLKPVDLHDACVVVEELVASLIESKGIELINNVPVDLPPAWADENRLQQILSNLVGNAIKFTDQGWVRVCAGVEDDGFIAVRICDTGEGIAPEQHEQVFKSFEQVDGSATRPQGGTGLGLAVTRSLVKALGGSIWVESQLGAGACFTFTLPVASAEQVAAAGVPVALVPPAPGSAVPPPPEWQAPVQPMPGQPMPGQPMPGQLVSEQPVSEQSIAEQAPFESPSADPLAASAPAVENPSSAAIKRLRGDGQRVLVVDDDPINRRVLCNQLGLQGYRVDNAADGRAALALLDHLGRGEQVIVLVDVMMPRMNGYELCRALRERFDPSDLPILFMTARTQEQDVLKGFIAGANDYLPKPFSQGELIARVHVHATLARRTGELRALTHELEQRVAERTRALAEANQSLERLAMCDGLTKVYNRRYLDQALNREWRRAQREQRPLAALMIDLDYFKQYNDACGHQEGDRCLQRIAEALTEQAQRAGDLVARYGGEEFCVVVQSNAERASALAEQIRQAVVALAIPHPSSAVAGHVTVSVGVAALVPTRDTDPDELIKGADKALYQSKREGRNRVSVQR
ncbi:diguanylate cyclase [Halochromatium glycolicum]|uniref:histidine kinase n=1 Tax=Halochromatium glycolicum TaxID=85075 RepID=A0AAJ0UAF0_9GAMM|nr:diguanylate cyclase [Halochromatium glycolicum]MBK1707067.1 diguanylate cyclase [Halochromatium glycolicum]